MIEIRRGAVDPDVTDDVTDDVAGNVFLVVCTLRQTKRTNGMSSVVHRLPEDDDCCCCCCCDGSADDPFKIGFVMVDKQISGRLSFSLSLSLSLSFVVCFLPSCRSFNVCLRWASKTDCDWISAEAVLSGHSRSLTRTVSLCVCACTCVCGSFSSCCRRSRRNRAVWVAKVTAAILPVRV